MYKKVFGGMIMALGIFAITNIASAASIGSVSFRFCDDVDNSIYLANQKTIAVNPGEDNEVCINFTNESEEKVEVTYGLSYGFLNKGGTQVCDQNSLRDNKFSKFFVQSGESILILESGEKKTLKIQIKVPLGTSGMQYGCFINTVKGIGDTTQKAAGSMFGVVVRKVFPLNLFVGKPGEIKNSLKLASMTGGLYTTNSKIKAEIIEGSNMNISARIKNEGNITQIVQISGSISNFLGFEKIFMGQEIKLTPGEEKDFVTNIGVIPGYKGLFTLNMNVKGTPFFDFEINGVDDAIKNGVTLNEGATIYAFSRISIIAVIVVIGIIILIFRPRKKYIIQKA